MSKDYLAGLYQGQPVLFHFKNTPDKPFTGFINSIDAGSKTLGIFYFSVSSGLMYAHGCKHIDDPWNLDHHTQAVENGTFSLPENVILDEALHKLSSLAERVKHLEAEQHLSKIGKRETAKV